MKTLALNAVARTNFGKKASKEIRNTGYIPCVMYGGEETLHFQIKDDELRALLYSPDVVVVEISLDGKVYKAILKESQFHPVKDTTLHLDFLQVFEMASSSFLLYSVPYSVGWEI